MSSFEWPSRWEKKQRFIEAGAVDWENLRRNNLLMGYLQVPRGRLSVLLELLLKYKVPLSLCKDVAYGNPRREIVQGVPVTTASIRSAIYMQRIAKQWCCPPRIRVLEIGGGFGAFCRTMLFHWQKIRSYTSVDDPTCLELQRNYLQGVFRHSPEILELIEMVSAHDLTSLRERHFDLVVSTNSLCEMRREEVDAYFRLIQETLEVGGAFYSAHQSTLPAEVPFSEFPYDRRWRFLLKSSGREPFREHEALAIREKP